MNLFINYYEDSNEERDAELKLCVHNNLLNPGIEQIFCLADPKFKFEDKKIRHIPFDHRPTFQDIFKVVNTFTGPDDINIIANTDIYFPDSFPSLPKHNEVYALTRWDVLTDGRIVFYNNSGSQDTWIFRGPIRKVPGAEYTQGVAGCDNKIAWELEQAGYKVTNPSKTIKTFHLHNSNIRHYDKIKPGEKDIYRIPHPRKNVTIT